MAVTTIDWEFDDMGYSFEEPKHVGDAYHAEFQLWCAVLYQWLQDLRSKEDFIRRQAIAWVNNKNDMRMVCNFAGVKPEYIEKLANDERIK